MNRSDAAALALVGWSPLLPPTFGQDRALKYAPLSEWKLISTFDSERACQHMLQELIKRMPDTAIDAARCVPSNDPHLVPEQTITRVELTPSSL
jgi:hypothetical protein